MLPNKRTSSIAAYATSAVDSSLAYAAMAAKQAHNESSWNKNVKKVKKAHQKGILRADLGISTRGDRCTVVGVKW